jgi:hypothetical protein
MICCATVRGGVRWPSYIGGKRAIVVRSDNPMFEACVRLNVECSERIMLVRFSISLRNGGFEAGGNLVRRTWC